MSKRDVALEAVVAAARKADKLLGTPLTFLVVSELSDAIAELDRIDAGKYDKDEGLRRLISAPKPGSAWRHFKGGQYVMEAAGLHVRDCEPTLSYRASDGVLWFREMDEFMGSKDGTPRFKRDGD